MSSGTVRFDVQYDGSRIGWRGGVWGYDVVVRRRGYILNLGIRHQPVPEESQPTFDIPPNTYATGAQGVLIASWGNCDSVMIMGTVGQTLFNKTYQQYDNSIILFLQTGLSYPQR